MSTARITNSTQMGNSVKDGSSRYVWGVYCTDLSSKFQSFIQA